MRRVGKYDIIRQLGEGGMGTVYLARDGLLGRNIALKTIRLDTASPPARAAELRDRLLREARAAARLRHPNIVVIHEAADDDGVFFIAMEYIEGGSLDCRRCCSDRALTLELLEQAASALDYAHSEGVVHRDVKPANLIVTPERKLKIVDFGIAKATGESGLTQAGMIVGTPAYMSPERIRCLEADGRSDQFSLAVVAYEMLTGERPFAGEDLFVLGNHILSGAPRPLEGARLNAVFAKALAKNPAERYATCRQFVNALAEALADSAAADAVETKLAPVTRVRTGSAIAISSVIILLVLIAAAIYFTAGREPAKTALASQPITIPPPVSTPRSSPPASIKSPEHKPSEKPRQPAAEVERPTPIKESHSETHQIMDAPWPTFRGGLTRSGVAAVNGPAHQPQKVWEAELGGQLRGSPVIGAGNVVYVGSTDKNLYAVQNGKILWSFPAGDPIEGAPAIDRFGRIGFRTLSGASMWVASDGTALNGAAAGAFEPQARSSDGHAYSVSGSVLRRVGSAWKADLPEPSSTTPAIGADGRIFVGTAAGSLIAVNPEGAIDWTYHAAARITTPPAITPDGHVYFGCGDRNLYCIREGQLRWKFLTGGPIYSAPVIDRNGAVYFGSNDGRLYAVNASGEELWRFDLGGEVRGSPAFDREGRIYAAAINRRLFCLR